MNMPASVLDAQLQQLLGLVTDYRDTRCNALLDKARQQASEMLRQARHDALLRVRAAIAEQRARGHQKIETTQAKLQTRHRQHVQQETLEILERAWSLLHDALRRRWDQADTRAIWIDNAVTQALGILPAEMWEIRHAPGWNEDEMRNHVAEITRYCGTAPNLAADASIGAGLRICCAGACVDASEAGLLANHNDVTARLLAELHHSCGIGNPECVS